MPEPLSHGAGPYRNGLRRRGPVRLACVSTQEDHAADRRMALSVGVLMVVEVVLAGLADAGTIGLGVWLALTVAAILAVAAGAAWLQRRPTR